jgi:prepilin-type N-terminal cleavage/methylation domain-containing protein
MISSRNTAKARRGFTLIELLVVIAILSLLVSILLPALKGARDQARTAMCMTNVKGMGMALHLYAQDNNDSLIIGAYPGGPPITVYLYWYQGLGPYLNDPWAVFASKEATPHLQCAAVEVSFEGTTQARYSLAYGWNHINFGYSPENHLKGWASKLSDVPSPSDTIIIGDSKEPDGDTMMAYQHMYLYCYPGDEYLCAVRHQGGGNYLMVAGNVSRMTPEEVTSGDGYYMKQVK